MSTPPEFEPNGTKVPLEGQDWEICGRTHGFYLLKREEDAGGGETLRHRTTMRFEKLHALLSPPPTESPNSPRPSGLKKDPTKKSGHEMFLHRRENRRLAVLSR